MLLLIRHLLVVRCKESEWNLLDHLDGNLSSLTRFHQYAGILFLGATNVTCGICANLHYHYHDIGHSLSLSLLLLFI